jgi:uncharacterized repeat protein (TIGR03803 family)
MAMNRKNPQPRNRSLILITLLTFVGNAFAGSKYQVIERFQQAGIAVHYPTNLTADKAGNIYGVANAGGKYGFGGVYELKPPGTKGGAWTRTLLYSFPRGCAGCLMPGSLVLDQSGNLYGAVSVSAGGVVFQLKRPANGGGKWTETDIYIFNGWDGDAPDGLALDSSGNLYGTTLGGGRYCGGQGCGTVYKLAPSTQGGRWKRTVLYFFKGVPGDRGVGDGAAPLGVTFNKNGNLYGTTLAGGQCQTGMCAGTVFKLQHPQRQGGAWREEVLYRFSNPNNQPSSGVVIGRSGALYGATSDFVYRLALVGSVWRETDLASVCCSYNGVILDEAGNVYGTAYSQSQYPNGMVYKLSPPYWTQTVLHAFAGGSDGSGPQSPVTFGPDGALYGTTLTGGNQQCVDYDNVGCGTVFRVVP